MSAQRVSLKVTRLAAQLASVQAGPSSRPLPPSIKSLRVRYAGLKGNAGARHWAQDALPGIRYANPSVQVIIDPKPAVEAPAVDGGTPAAPSTAYKTHPGVLISFHDRPTPLFFPLTNARSEKLVKRFWDTVEDPAALQALADGAPGGPAGGEGAAIAASVDHASAGEGVAHVREGQALEGQPAAEAEFQHVKEEDAVSSAAGR